MFVDARALEMRNTISNLTFGLAMLFAILSMTPAHASSPVTSYEAMSTELAADAARSHDIAVTSIGTASSGKRKIWLVRVASPKADTTKTVRLLVLCRQHGDEPASTEAVLGLLSRVSAGRDAAVLKELGRVTLYLVPMVNPDGADAGTRENGVGADLNRDWGVFSQPETRAIKTAVAAIRPHVIVDAHNWDTGEHDFNSIEAALPDHSALVESIGSLQSDAVQSLHEVGFGVLPKFFGPGNDPTLAHRYFTSTGKISMLVETHPGSPVDLADFARRQQLYVALIHMLMRTLAHDADFRRGKLDQLEGYGNYRKATTEAAMFASSAQHVEKATTVASTSKPAKKRPLWLLPVCAMALILILSRTGFTAARLGEPQSTARPMSRMAEHWSRVTEPERFQVPATEWRLAFRRGKRLCRYSRYETESRLPAGAYDRTPRTPIHDTSPPSLDEESCLPAISR